MARTQRKEARGGPLGQSLESALQLMGSPPEQHMDHLPVHKRKEAYLQIGRVGLLRSQGYSEDKVAEKAGFRSVDDMYFRLKRWRLPGSLPSDEKRPRETSKARAAEGTREELPTIANAATTFRDTIRTAAGAG